MECHKCDHYMKGDPVCWTCAEDSPDIPLNNHGQSSVGYDELHGTRHEPRTSRTAADAAMQDEDMEMDASEPEAPPVHGPMFARVPVDAMETFARFFNRLFLTLDGTELAILAMRYRSLASTDGRPTMEEIGNMLGETKQGVNYRIGNIVAKLPEVRAMFPLMRKALQDGAQKAMEESVAVWRERGLMPLRQTDYNTFLDRTLRAAWRERKAEEERAERERREAEERRRAPTLFDWAGISQTT